MSEEKIRKIIETWRETADIRRINDGSEYAKGWSDRLHECARELEFTLNGEVRS